MIELLIQKVFTTRNNSHLAHWKSKSYAQHMALGSFYDDMIEAIDKIVEIYQGNFGLIGEVSGEYRTPTSILDQLVSDSEWIAQNRTDIAKGLTAAENQIDELLGIYMQTIYKLINLS